MAARKDRRPWEKHHYTVTDIQIPFHDVDMLEVAWHGHYYKYFELARTDLFDSYGMKISQIRALGYAMVVSDSNCRYMYPLLYGQKAQVYAYIDPADLEFRIVVKYVIVDAETQKHLARGSTIHLSLDGETRSLYGNTPEPIFRAFSTRPTQQGDPNIG